MSFAGPLPSPTEQAAMQTDMFGFTAPNTTDRPLNIDAFAGGGGASLGIAQALGREVDIAINHDPVALSMHKMNHSETFHVPTDVWATDLEGLTHGRQVNHLHASPDCKHHSRARGGKPASKKIRGLAWWVLKAAGKWRPALITLENVVEFEDWGPLDHEGRPNKNLKGQTFRFWCKKLERLGYRWEKRWLKACDYGTPTIRKRLWIIARRDGRPIVWPEPTHGPGRDAPYRTAASIIDWDIPVPSIFERARPLADATLCRIARGIKKFVLDDGAPFLVQTGFGERPGQAPRVMSVDQPLGTVVAGGIKHGLAVAHLMDVNHSTDQRHRGHRPDESFRTVTSSQGQALVKYHINGVGGRQSQTAPVDMAEPLSTVTVKNDKVLVSAYMAQHNLGATGHPLSSPVSTLTATGSQQALVAAFVAKYYGTAVGQQVKDPLHTVTSKERFGLITVTIEGAEYVVTDIGMRMLTPRELFRAQGFPDSYIIDRDRSGVRFTQAKQVALCGNSVCPQWSDAITRANHPELQAEYLNGERESHTQSRVG